jgi:hypothetical protein
MFEMQSATVLRQAKAGELTALVRGWQPRRHRGRSVGLAPARTFRVLGHPFLSRAATVRAAH